MKTIKRLLWIIIIYNYNFLAAQNASSGNCIKPFMNTDLTSLNWKVDSNHVLIINNNHQCDSNYSFNRTGEISITVKDKIKGSILSNFYLQVIHLSELDRSIFDFGIISMGDHLPNIILIRETYIREIDNIYTVNLYKLECKNGKLIETLIE
jgi:hypothetical protein